MSKHKIDDIFRNAFPQQEFTNSDAGWEKAAAMLDAQAPAATATSSLWKVGSIAIAAICSIGLVWWFTLTETSKYNPNQTSQAPVVFEPIQFNTSAIELEEAEELATANHIEEHIVDATLQINNSKNSAKSARTIDRRTSKKLAASHSRVEKHNTNQGQSDNSSAARHKQIDKPQAPSKSHISANSKESRTIFKGQKLAQIKKIKSLSPLDLPNAMVLDLSQNKGNEKSSYYKRWQHSIYALGGALYVPSMSTNGENSQSTSKADVSAYSLQSGMGWYAQRNQFRFGLGAQHSSIRRNSSFESMSLKDTVYQTIETRNEITSIDSTYNGLVWDTTGPIDKFIEDWSVDTSYQKVSDTTNTPGVDTSFNTQSTHIVQAYVEIPVFFGYVITRGRIQYSIQGGYSLGYLYRQRITGSFAENATVQNSYDIEQRLTHSVFFNPEVSYMLSDKASIFAQPTMSYRLSGGTPKFLKPTSFGLRFGLAYHF